jgi:hypothetical protein
MSYTERFTEVHYPLAMDYADSFAIGTHTSNYVSLMNYHRAVFVINVGDIGAGGFLDARVLQATTTTGTSAKAITGKSITRLTQADGDGDDLLAIELQTEELDVSNNFDCVALELTVGSATIELSYIVYGIVPRFPPTGTTNWAEVVT